MSNTFTGDREVYIELLNYLISKGFNLHGKDAIHIGDNKYEFKENYDLNMLGIRHTHTVLVWKEGKDIKYKVKVIGFVAND